MDSISTLHQQIIKQLEGYFVEECAVSVMHSQKVASFCIANFGQNSSQETLYPVQEGEDALAIKLVLHAYSVIRGISFEQNYLPNIQELRQMIYDIYDHQAKEEICR